MIHVVYSCASLCCGTSSAIPVAAEQRRVLDLDTGCEIEAVCVCGRPHLWLLINGVALFFSAQSQFQTEWAFYYEFSFKNAKTLCFWFCTADTSFFVMYMLVTWDEIQHCLFLMYFWLGVLYLFSWTPQIVAAFLCQETLFLLSYAVHFRPHLSLPSLYVKITITMRFIKY